MKLEDIMLSEINQSQDFPGGPEVRTPHFHCMGHEFDTWSGNKDHACLTAWPKKEIKQSQKDKYCMILLI